ncbi:MAG: cytochrome c family protein [Erythrobacter sp.]|nr:cytochrome c family protein [Erythrobacter sp.]
MTQENSSETTPEAGTGGGDLFNTAAGWVLFAAGLGLGLSILSGKYFHGDDPQRPEQLGYVIEGVVEDDGPAAEMTMAAALNMAETTASAGEKVYAKCSACHTLTPGGANGVGPNLHGIMGAPLAAKPGFAYSNALKEKGGVWDWETMNEWLKSPRSFADGTKMSFAGLSKIEDRAAVALFMNEAGSNLPVPEYVEAVAEGADGEESADVEEVAETGSDAGQVAEAEAEQDTGEEIAEAAGEE